MSKDQDGHQRRWLALGHGGKTSSPSTWRYWETGDRRWTIMAPHELAEFDQQHRTVYFRGEKIIEAKSQWAATWQALSYFYGTVVPKLKPPPLK